MKFESPLSFVEQLVQMQTAGLQEDCTITNFSIEYTIMYTDSLCSPSELNGNHGWVCVGSIAQEETTVKRNT